MMARFATSGVYEPSTVPDKRPAYDEAVPYARGGRDVLTNYWTHLTRPQKAAFRPHADALGKIADEADRAKTEEAVPEIVP